MLRAITIAALILSGTTAFALTADDEIVAAFAECQKHYDVGKEWPGSKMSFLPGWEGCTKIRDEFVKTQPGRERAKKEAEEAAAKKKIEDLVKRLQ